MSEQPQHELERPSTLLSGMLLWLLQYGSAIFAFLFFAVGVGFVVMSFIQMPLIKFFTGGQSIELEGASKMLTERLTITIGVAFVLIALLFAFIKYLSSLSRTRNNYIEALEKKLEQAGKELEQAKKATAASASDAPPTTEGQ